MLSLPPLPPSDAPAVPPLLLPLVEAWVPPLVRLLPAEPAVPVALDSLPEPEQAAGAKARHVSALKHLNTNAGRRMPEAYPTPRGDGVALAQFFDTRNTPPPPYCVPWSVQ